LYNQHQVLYNNIHSNISDNIINISNEYQYSESMKKITKKRAKDPQYIYDPGFYYGGGLYPEGGTIPYTPNTNVPSEHQPIVDWYQSYVSSPKYTERLGNFWRSPEDIQKQRAATYSNIKFNDPTSSKNLSYYPNTNDITVSPDAIRLEQMGNPKAKPRDIQEDIVAHELGHGVNTGKNPGSNLNWVEEQYILNRNKNISPDLKKRVFETMAIQDKPDTLYPQKRKASDQLTDELHDLSPAESKSDIDAVRYLLNREGIYDARKEDLNQGVLDKAKQNKVLKNSPTFKRLQENFKDKDLIDIFNKVAFNPNNTNNINTNNINNNTMYGMYGLRYEDGGNLSREEDYGSKKKPYPMVDSGDFAGPHRSYPIPTRSNAVDALRLAGLHHNEAVKEKVYRKYPDLRKQWGGPTNIHALQSQGYNFTPNQTYMMDDGSFNSPSSVFEYGGYVEKFNEGSAFCDPTPNYTRNMSNGELGGKYGFPPKVYASGGNVDYNTGNGRTGHFIEGSMFEPQYANYVHNWHGQAYPNIPPKVYENGGRAPKVEPNRAFTASPFPYDSMYHSNYRSNSYVNTFANGGDIGPSTSEYGLYTYDTGINPTDYMSDEYPIAKSGIHINPANKGKFNATKKRTGKTTEELTHSSNPLTRKRAIFAQNARKWHHEYGGIPGIDSNYSNYGYNGAMAANGMGINNPFRQYSTEENPIYYQGNNDNASSLPINSPLQSGSQDLANSAGTSNNNRGGMSTSFTLGTLGPIMAASALAGQISNQQSNAKYSAMDKRRNIQSGPYYNPYGYGDGSGMLANGGKMNNINATRGHKASMTLADAMDIIRQHGYDIEVND
jgi:hypothetical protein